MKKLVERAHKEQPNEFLREDQLRPDLRQLLHLPKYEGTFPRKVLLDMSLLEIVSLWCQGAQSGVEKLDRARWLHAALGSPILIFFALKKLAEQTENVLPPDWKTRSISELVANRGGFMVPCQTPDGTEGRKHTFPLWNLQVVVEWPSNITTWHGPIEKGA